MSSNANGVEVGWPLLQKWVKMQYILFCCLIFIVGSLSVPMVVLGFPNE